MILMAILRERKLTTYYTFFIAIPDQKLRCRLHTRSRLHAAYRDYWNVESMGVQVLNPTWYEGVLLLVKDMSETMGRTTWRRKGQALYVRPGHLWPPDPPLTKPLINSAAPSLKELKAIPIPRMRRERAFLVMSLSCCSGMMFFISQQTVEEKNILK